MSANVISHPSARRKRAGARSWAARHIGLLLATAAGLIAASWLAPDIRQPAQAPAALPPRTAQPAVQPALTTPAALDQAAADQPVARPQRRANQRRTVRPTGVPLDAAGAEPADYEILNAAELAAISQAPE